MNASTIGPILTKCDIAFDFIPFASIINNAVDLVAKAALASLSTFWTSFYEGIEDNPYVMHLEKKKVRDCFFLMIPLLNFFVAIGRHCLSKSTKRESDGNKCKASRDRDWEARSHKTEPYVPTATVPTFRTSEEALQAMQQGQQRLDVVMQEQERKREENPETHKKNLQKLKQRREEIAQQMKTIERTAKEECSQFIRIAKNADELFQKTKDTNKAVTYLGLMYGIDKHTAEISYKALQDTIGVLIKIIPDAQRAKDQMDATWKKDNEEMRVIDSQIKQALEDMESNKDEEAYKKIISLTQVAIDRMTASLEKAGQTVGSYMIEYTAFSEN